MRTPNFRAGLPIVGLLTAGVLWGCSSIPNTTRENVARSETSFQQAQQAIGRSEAGAIELQRAKDNLDQAKGAMANKEAQKADRYAQLAQLDSELAMSKSQSAAARKAADELTASIQQLRQEVARGNAVATDQQ
jgi:hypothetical protein